MWHAAHSPLAYYMQLTRIIQVNQQVSLAVSLPTTKLCRGSESATRQTAARATNRTCRQYRAARCIKGSIQACIGTRARAHAQASSIRILRILRTRTSIRIRIHTTDYGLRTHNLALFGITGSILAAKEFWLFVQSLQWHLSRFIIASLQPWLLHCITAVLLLCSSVLRGLSSVLVKSQ